MLDVVCFKWKPLIANYRSKFKGHHVNVLRNMVARNYAGEHRFSCITDDPSGIDNNIRIIPLWKDFANIRSPFGIHQPSCYRRLKLFSQEAKDIIGERFVCLDLDVVITGDLSPLWDRTEEFVALESATVSPRYRYNGSMLMMTAGSRVKVWNDFHPISSPKITKGLGWFGSDQAWISYRLGDGEATWGTADGVYSYRIHIAPKNNVLPKNAKLVVFHGIDDPWEHKAQGFDWVRANWK